MMSIEDIIYGMNNEIHRTGTITAPKWSLAIYAAQNYVNDTAFYNSVGGTGTINEYANYNKVISVPTVSAGTVNQNIYGNYTMIQAGTAGNTTAYGEYVTFLGAADTNWLFYAGGIIGNNFLGGDSITNFFGTGKDAGIVFDGNSLNIDANLVTATDTFELTAGGITLYAPSVTATGSVTAASLKLSALPPIYANNAAAIASGLAAGQLYRSGTDPDILYIVH
jgi:hypothetical protein